MSAAHTPGPWRFQIHESANGDEIYGFEVLTSVKRELVYFDADGRSETEANARLIAAAPDLLAALEGVRDILGTAESNASGRGDEWDYVGPRVVAARAAIARATGAA